MAQEEFLCISYFDTIIGPTIFYCNEELSEEFDHPDLGRILDISDQEGTFIFAFRNYQTSNHIFYIESENARGGRLLLMISYMIRAEYFRNEITDVFKYLETKNPILEEYAFSLKELREFPVVLNKQNNKYLFKNKISLGSNEFQKRFLDLFNSYFSRLSIKMNSFREGISEGTKKIFIFGAENASKTTFLKNLETIQLDKQNKLDISTKIFDVVIDNMEIVMEDCIDKQFKCEQCNKQNRCINKAQGFILIFNVSDKQSLMDAKEQFKVIINRICNISLENKTPILILGNTFNNKDQIDEQLIYETLDLEQAKKCNVAIEYFSVNLLESDGETMRPLRWIIRNII